MSDQKDRAQRLKSLMLQPGWADLIKSKDEEVAKNTDALLSMMDSKPETLTGKTAIRYASKRKALISFFEDLSDEVRINAPDSSNG
jgi:hypothetical protein